MPNKTTAPLESKIADRLLDLLGDSDKFRELFQSDPAAALALIGYEAPTAAKAAASASLSITDCLRVTELASKESIRSAHGELKAMLLRGLSQITPNLDATYSE